MHSLSNIKQIINNDFNSLIQPSFPQLAKTAVGEPIPVFDTDYLQKFWLIPLLLNSKVRGTAIYDANMNLITYGIISPNVQDERKLMHKQFFDKVPDNFINEIKEQYPDFEIAIPFFSFDQAPQKWAWLVRLRKSGLLTLNIFIGPQGWYKQHVQPGFEG